MKKNEEGQALLELIVFLPLLFTVYAIVSGFANAIYGSINQQKFTRSYFYYRAQNNSTIPRRQGNVSWKRYGMFYVGWREKVQDDFPFAPCYRISIPVTNSSNEGCDDTYAGREGDNPSTQFMRVGTVYGFCGATFMRENNESIYAPNRVGLNYSLVTDAKSCLIED